MRNTDTIDDMLTSLGYGPNLTASNRDSSRPRPYMPSKAEQARARQARGPRPRAAQQPAQAPATDGLTAEERAIDAALNRPATAEGDDLADLDPADQALIRKWRETSPATLDDDDQAAAPASPTRGLNAADAALYRKAFGGR